MYLLQSFGHLNFILQLYIIMTMLIIVLSFVYYFLISNRHRKRMKTDTDLIKSCRFPESIQLTASRVAERRFDYIKNYIIFQLTNKVFGFASVLYSIMGIYAYSTDTEQWITVLISFSSLAFVVIALYLSPTSRISQYIEAWKMCDATIQKVLASTDCYGIESQPQQTPGCEQEQPSKEHADLSSMESLPSGELEEQNLNGNTTLRQSGVPCPQLKDEAMRIAATIINAEASLTTDSE